MKEIKVQNYNNKLDSVKSFPRSVSDRSLQSNESKTSDFPRPHFLNKFVKNTDSYDLQKDSDFKFNAFGYRKPLDEYSRYTEERKVHTIVILG